MRFETVRILLSIAAQEGLNLSQFDEKMAFLNGSLSEEIYMRQPKGFEDGSSRMCRLLKSLYGLKQAPRCWTEAFKGFLKSIGLKESSLDPCLYHRIEKDRKILVAFWVDDGLVATSCKGDAEHFFDKMSQVFEITVTDKVEYFLGVQISRISKNSIFINQACYVDKILEKFDMQSANAVDTPIDPGWDDSIVKSNELNVPYREAVGSLMYLQVVSRPDIAFAINVASRALENPTSNHWKLVKRILRYVKGTKDFWSFIYW